MKTDRGAVVLFVSPDTRLTDALKTDLAPHLVDVQPVRSRTEAVGRAQQTVPAAIVVDARPVEQQSYATIERLRKAVPPTTAILWLSSDVTRSKVLQAIKSGATAILVRPVAAATFVDTLSKALQRISNPAVKRIRTGVPVPESPAPAEEIWQTLENAESLKTVPFVVQQVMTLTTADETGAADLEKVILKDQNATAVVLRRANSPIFAASRKVTKIREAITRLGFRNVRTLVMALSVIKNFDLQQRRSGFDPVEFWKSCTASAILGRNLAAKVGLPDPESAYICGLLHNIGMIICDEFVTEPFHRAVDIAIDQGTSLLKAERAVFGLDHAEIGRGILERWSFPREICEVAGIANPQHPSIADPTLRRLAQIVWAADAMCRSMGLGDAVDRTVEPFAAAWLAEIGLTSPLPREFFAASLAEINDTWDLLGSGAGQASLPGPDERDVAAVYEEEKVPLSLVQLLVESTGVRAQVVTSLNEMARLPEDLPGVVHFKSVDGLRAALHTSRNVLDRPYLILLPADQLPADDEMKKKVGFPVGKCRYLGLPAGAREIATAVAALPFAS